MLARANKTGNKFRVFYINLRGKSLYDAVHDFQNGSESVISRIRSYTGKIFMMFVKANKIHVRYCLKSKYKAIVPRI